MSEPQPNVIDGIPYCSNEDCPLYDGKRCEAMGARPGHICEPAVESMVVDLSTALANALTLRAQIPPPGSLTLTAEEVEKVRALVTFVRDAHGNNSLALRLNEALAILDRSGKK